MRDRLPPEFIALIEMVRTVTITLAFVALLVWGEPALAVLLMAEGVTAHLMLSEPRDLNR